VRVTSAGQIGLRDTFGVKSELWRSRLSNLMNCMARESAFGTEFRLHALTHHAELGGFSIGGSEIRNDHEARYRGGRSRLDPRGRRRGDAET
jgi:hypothetical protein